ncbi:hypothetical protein Bbelb_374560 [Branchiostoma belcheri]|nr:hypothetical protein Bbelb_374560 [Branchiostoma belcheri]
MPFCWFAHLAQNTVNDRSLLALCAVRGVVQYVVDVDVVKYEQSVQGQAVNAGIRRWVRQHSQPKTTIIANWVRKTYKSTLTATGRAQSVFTARNSGVIPSAMVARPCETLDITECASIGDITTKPSCVITGQRFCEIP